MKVPRFMTRLGLALPLVWSCSTSPEAEPPPVGASGGEQAAGQSGSAAANGAAANAGNGGANSAAGTANAAGTASAAGAVSVAGAPSVAGAGGSVGDGGRSAFWQPEPGLTWQWQLSETVKSPLDVDVYDIDWESDAALVEELHARGIHVICYVSVGSWEDFRPDADDFPASVLGNDYDGWPGEKYVDLRSSELRQILGRRFDICRDHGFDAIEPDNMDVFELGSDSGFPLTKADGIEFALWLAAEAHARGLSIGQKNAASITAAIEPSFDWALTESCFSDGNWCGEVSAYAAAQKPVFMCEYDADSFDAACASWAPQKYSPILKDLELDAQLTRCP